MNLDTASKLKKEFRPRKVKWDRDKLIRLRFDMKLSFPAIARKYKCDHTTVMWAFRRLGLPTSSTDTIEILEPAKKKPSIEREFVVQSETPEQAQMWRDLLTNAKKMRKATHVQA